MNAVLRANIVTLAHERGLSMAALSKRARAGVTAVFDIVNGRIRSPKLETVAKIADALDVTVVDLLSEKRRSEAEQAILDALADLPEDEQRRMLAVVLAMRGETPRA